MRIGLSAFALPFSASTRRHIAPSSLLLFASSSTMASPPPAKTMKTAGGEKGVCSDAPHKEIGDWLLEANHKYSELHESFENDFWGSKMALSSYKGTLVETKTALDDFLSDSERLSQAKAFVASGDGDAEQRKVLDMFVRTMNCYILPGEEAAKLKASITAAETALEEARNKMKLGMKPPGGGPFKELSSVQLRNIMRTNTDEAERKAAYEGLMEIGTFVTTNGFPEVVKQRNKLAKALGFEDFYDYKVTMAEGFGKKRLFSILDELEQRSRPLLSAARGTLEQRHGKDALHPWNTSFAMTGDVEAKQNPYFPFSRAVETWARTFEALGIDYKGASMDLDLLERKGKYSNGFCHWPIAPWLRPNGKYVPAKTNFTSLGDPKAVGSGRVGLKTLLHEGGHAAHFSNIMQPSPLFSQERAPTSVAYAENQSMFLDSLLSDAAWAGMYARDEEHKPLPWEMMEERIKATHPFECFALRAMLAVPYFEKGLYEMEEVTAEAITKLAEEVEERIQGGPSARPLLSVPHILADEASCYYHGYVLAEMSVHHTRAHFLKDGGRIVNNPEVGKALTEVYWKPGNSEMFLDLVERLTGKPLTSDAWVSSLEKPVEQLLKEEKADYEWASAQPDPYDGSQVDLKMKIRLVHGDDVIADTESDGGLLQACGKFKAYVDAM